MLTFVRPFRYFFFPWAKQPYIRFVTSARKKKFTFTIYLVYSTSFLFLSSYFYAVAVATISIHVYRKHNILHLLQVELFFSVPPNRNGKWTKFEIEDENNIRKSLTREITHDDWRVLFCSHKYHIINLFSNWIYLGVNRKSTLSFPFHWMSAMAAAAAITLCYLIFAIRGRFDLLIRKHVLASPHLQVSYSIFDKILFSQCMRYSLSLSLIFFNKYTQIAATYPIFVEPE